MELRQEVRFLADHLSQLSPEESASAERGGHLGADVQRQLSDHLVDQFWACVLRRSPHCPPPGQSRTKTSRYSVSSILEDLDLSPRKRVSRAAPHAGPSFDSTAPPLPASDRPHHQDAPKASYQRSDVYLEVAFQLHRQAMQRKGLQLESLALGVLLQLYGCISHVPRSSHVNRFAAPSTDRWTRFTSRDEVLEMLCHLSSEPVPCVSSLALGRHALLRKGVREVKHIDTKLFLGRLGDSRLKAGQALKWASGHSAPALREEAEPTSSERWTSRAFERALGKIPHPTPPAAASESTAAGLQHLTISPLLGPASERLPIHSAWLGVATAKQTETVHDEVPVIRPQLASDRDADVATLEEKVTGRWVLRPTPSSHLDLCGPEPPASTTATPSSKCSEHSHSPSVYDFRPFEEEGGHVKADVSRVSAFCRVTPDSCATVRHYGSWQSLPSFDTAVLRGNLRQCGAERLGHESIIDSMVDCTVRCLYGGAPSDKLPDPSIDVDWVKPVLTCLQGLESDLFASQARCQYAKDPSLVPEQLRKSSLYDITNRQLSPKTLCMSILDDFVASNSGPPNCTDLLGLSSDARFAKIPLAICPWQGSPLSVLTQLEPTPALKKLRGYSSLQPFFAEIAHVGTVIRNLKYFVALIRYLETRQAHRETIGTALVVYLSAVESYVHDFETALSTFAAQDFRGKLLETTSVYSLFLTHLRPWLKAIHWFEDVTFHSRCDDREHGYFTLFRAWCLVDCLIGKYVGSFGIWHPADDLSHAATYKCVVTTLRPYLGFLRHWLTGWRHEGEPPREFHRDGRLFIISPLLPLADLIAASRQLCSFMELHYASHLPPANSLFACLLPGLADHTMFHRGNTSPEFSPPFSALVRYLGEEIRANNAWLNRKALELLVLDYRIFDILADVDRYVFLSRLDLMDGVFDDWSSQGHSEALQNLLQSPLVIETSIESGADFSRHGATLRFSAGVFDTYVFTEDVVQCYNAVFRQLCAVHLGVRNVLQVSRWLCLNYRGQCAIGAPRCTAVLRRLCTLTREMQATLFGIEWYMRYAALGPLYATFVRRVRGGVGFFDFLSHHAAFAREARRLCLACREGGRCSVLLRALCHCTEILHASLRGLGFDVLRDANQVDSLLTLQPTLSELAAKFGRLKWELLCVVNASQDPALFHLGTVLAAAANDRTPL
ncbi:microsomal signal peptidase subunit gp23, putative [Babesia caballi]|uniref:Microsomal signal peptidase subunit gp23, putative n=1 Tax=Babesia caballi TaxID=5871 RepID=A0AAV4LTH4_BABCB|nr:microsomal signal peptidase subunit gp23, putative [Babesia caballi]